MHAKPKEKTSNSNSHPFSVGGIARTIGGYIHDGRARMAHIRQPAARDRGDGWKLNDAQAGVKTALFLLGLPALLPLVFMAPSVIRLSSVAHAAGNDVLGTGGALLLFATLAISPLVLITGYRWFVPLRRWYGIVFALDVILDAIIAANDPAFGRSIQADLTGHSFLLAGLVMVLISVPLLITGALNKRLMRWLGKYWKTLQAIGTYTIWGILGIHLLLLEGFKPGHTPDIFPFTVLHQRLYEYLACAISLLIFRLPVVRRSAMARRWLTIPCMALFAAGYLLFINELMFKGVAAYALHPVND